MAWVAILMGSESDWPVMKGTTGVLNDLGIEFEVRVTSEQGAQELDIRAREDERRGEWGVHARRHARLVSKVLLVRDADRGIE